MSQTPSPSETEERGLVVVQRPAEDLAEWTPRFALSVDEAVSIVEQKREFFQRVMREGEHYGPIPGAGDKKNLLKPGAELLLSSMSLHPTYEIEDKVIDLLGREYGGEPFVSFDFKCVIWRQTGPTEHDRMLVAEGTGECNSWEKKYRYRNAERVCPECGAAAIIKGKAEYGGGWLCWKKKDGCGTSFSITDKRIVEQASGQTLNPEVADLVNTIKKMAKKRALVDATLNATGCSDIFTQDMEDTATAASEIIDQPAEAPVSAAGIPPGIEELNNRLPESKRLSFAMLKGKLSRPNGAEVTRQELLALQPEEAVGAPVEQPAAPASAEVGEAAPSGELEEEPAQGATVPSGPFGLRPGQVVGIQPFETTLGNGQKVTQYRVHLTTDLGERILGPFNTEAEAIQAVETGELPAATPEPEPAAPPAAEPRRKGSRGIAPGMTPPPQPEPPEPTLEQQLEESVEATARHPMLATTPPPADDPFEAPQAAQPEVQDVMTAAEARLYRIRECAAEIKKIQHDKRGEEIPAEETLAMEAGQSLDQLSKQKYGREFIQLTDDEYQGVLDWLEARLEEAQAA